MTNGHVLPEDLAHAMRAWCSTGWSASRSPPDDFDIVNGGGTRHPHAPDLDASSSSSTTALRR